MRMCTLYSLKLSSLWTRMGYKWVWIYEYLHASLLLDTPGCWGPWSQRWLAPAPASPSPHLAGQFETVSFWTASRGFLSKLACKGIPRELLWPPDKEDTEFLITLGMEVLAWSLRVAILACPPPFLWKQACGQIQGICVQWNSNNENMKLDPSEWILVLIGCHGASSYPMNNEQV